MVPEGIIEYLPVGHGWAIWLWGRPQDHKLYHLHGSQWTYCACRVPDDVGKRIEWLGRLLK